MNAAQKQQHTPCQNELLAASRPEKPDRDQGHEGMTVEDFMPRPFLCFVCLLSPSLLFNCLYFLPFFYSIMAGPFCLFYFLLRFSFIAFILFYPISSTISLFLIKRWCQVPAPEHPGGRCRGPLSARGCGPTAVHGTLQRGRCDLSTVRGGCP